MSNSNNGNDCSHLVSKVWNLAHALRDQAFAADEGLALVVSCCGQGGTL